MENRLTRISTFLSLVLRHKPESIGLPLDAEGCAEISDVALSRAVHGHSVEVNLGLAPILPPHTLFHGTAAGTCHAILREGLRPMGRRYVHLSAELGTARLSCSGSMRPP